MVQILARSIVHYQVRTFLQKHNLSVKALKIVDFHEDLHVGQVLLAEELEVATILHVFF